MIRDIVVYSVFLGFYAKNYIFVKDSFLKNVFMELVEKKIEYQPEIKYLSISEIEPNRFNPRQRFNEEEEDELIQSIIEKGILNPIVVYKKAKENKYVILDGERRFRASKKLNISELPARILLDEPDKLESLSLMFHIHHVQKDWTQFAISMTLIEIIKEKGMDPKSLTRDNKRELVKITSLSEYKINRFLIFQDYPDEVIQRFLKSEIEGKEEEGADPDILLEMYRPIRQIKTLMPGLLKKYPIAKIIDSCIKKKAKNIIKTNKDFRFISKCLTASKKGRINIHKLEEELIDFIKNINVTPETIYLKTAEAFFQVDSISKSTDSLAGEINDLNLANITKMDKAAIKLKMTTLIKIIKSRFGI